MNNPTNGSPPGFAALLAGHLRQSIYSYSQLAQLSGVPKRTIVNWLDGSVQRPRRWQSVVRLALAFRLTAAETDALLCAAGLPALKTLRSQCSQLEDVALLRHWPPGAQDHHAILNAVAADQALIRCYCLQVVATNERLDSFFPTDVPFSFEEIFQEPDVRLLYGAAAVSPVGNGLAGTAGEVIPWPSLRDHLRRAVIVGPPGSGKSWLLRHEALRLARQALASDGAAAPIPFLLRVTDLAAHLSCPVMPEQVLRAIASQCAIQAVGRAEPSLVAALNRLLIEQPARTVFLLDNSLGEPEHASRVALARRALDLLARTTSGSIWVTARHLGYAGPPFPLDGWPQGAELELTPLRRSAILQIVRAWYPDQPRRTQAFLEVLGRSPTLEDQASNPRLLHVYCRLMAGLDLARLPCICELQDQALALMLQREGETAHPSSAEPMRWQVKLRLLQRLAWELATYQGQWHWHLAGEPLEALLDQLPEAQQLSTSYAPSGKRCYPGILWELSEQDGLLVKGEVSREGLVSILPYAFLHRALHTFLVARHVVSCYLAHGTEAQELIELAHCDLSHSGWLDVATLLMEYTGVAPHPKATLLHRWLCEHLPAATA